MTPTPLPRLPHHLDLPQAGTQRLLHLHVLPRLQPLHHLLRVAPVRRRHLHHLHLPYHLHIYTREALLQLASRHDLEPIAFYPRFYLESPMFGMNEAFLRRYLQRLDDNIDALLDPPPVGLILTSPSLIFHGLFGYLWSPRHSITVGVQKALRKLLLYGL